ncbi:MAG TPA: trypsin-like peptidase domain-containing protein [Clostridia bacterium]
MKRNFKLPIIFLLLIICFVFLTACPNTNINPNTPNQPQEDSKNAYSLSEFGQTVNNVIKGCVEIKTQGTFGGGLGSGFVIGKAEANYPVIVTNYHVIKEAQKNPNLFNIYIKFGDKADYYPQPAIILGYDADMDIAVLLLRKSVQDIDSRILTWGNSRAVYLGQEVFAIGNSLGYGTALTQGVVSVTEEILQNKDRETGKEFTRYAIRHSAAIISGNSGGALFNLKGEVIGVNSYGYLAQVIGEDQKPTGDYYNAANMSLAIPSNLARAVSDYVLENYNGEEVDASIPRTSGGDFMSCLDKIKPRLSSDDKNVLTVSESISFLGLNTNDVIVKINNWDVKNLYLDSNQVLSPSILVELCYYYSPQGGGKELTITVNRNGVVTNITTNFRQKLSLPDWIQDIQKAWS